MCKQFLQDERFSGPAYWLEPSGRCVDRLAAEELIAKGKLAPVRDGLFGEDSQTFERVH